MTLYQQLRSAGKEMHGKALDNTKHLDFNPIRAAKRMTLPRAGRALIFADEAEQNAFFDFLLHEYRVSGKTLMESVNPATAGLTSLEAELLDAHCRAHTSLFRTEAWPSDQHHVRLRDLLDSSREEILLTDIGLSESLSQIRAPMTLFCRLLTLRGINLTSGFNFAFKAERDLGLLQAYRQKTKRTPLESLSEHRFVFFFQKFRQCGEEQRSRDVA